MKLRLFRKDDDLDVPGTKLMDEFDPSSETVRQLLIPEPSKAPDDPLNWSSKWKLTVILAQGCFVMVSLIPSLSVVPLFPYLAAKWNTSPSKTSMLGGVVVITQGYSNFVIVPCFEIFGRRPTLLVCSIMCIGANIWQATANSYNSFMGARIFLGLVSAINESLMPVIVTDMFFLHERGKYMSFYFFTYFMGLYLGPIISGGVAYHVSYKWFFWAGMIAQALCTVLILLVVPETRFSRSSESVVLGGAAQQPSGDADAKGGDESVLHEEKKAVPSSGSSSNNSVLDVNHRIVGKPTRSQLMPWQTVNIKDILSALNLHVWHPIKLFFNPIVFWAGITTMGTANSLLGVSYLQAVALVNEPYNFNSQEVGFCNFAMAAGGIIGLLSAGPFSDWVAEKLTLKNNGIREPEMRLWSIIPHVILSFISFFVIGFGLQAGRSWPSIVVVGFSFVGLVTISIPTIAITYAVDCYKPVSGQIMMIVTVIKNSFGFSLSYFLLDWAARDGYVPPNMMMMGLSVGTCLLGLIVLPIYGKSIRRWTKNSAVHSL